MFCFPFHWFKKRKYTELDELEEILMTDE